MLSARQQQLLNIWEEHTKYEFTELSPQKTVDTMVEDAYVNHIPTLTGGHGKQDLLHFYANYFIGKNPPDTKMTTLSTTIGNDSLVAELHTTLTHTCEIPYMLPGIPPTYKKLELVIVVIVQFEGDKLKHEHIYWDQGSVLVQLGLIDPSGLPLAGAVCAQKAKNPLCIPSNQLIKEKTLS